MASKKTVLDQPLGGLFIMSIFTIVWTALAEYYFAGFDFRIVGVVFGAVLIYFIYSYRKLSRQAALLPETNEAVNSQQERSYWIIVILEGTAIFAANVILTNIGKAEYFIACFALIVGLHFIPLAGVFGRKFDYYIGFWTILVALAGLAIIYRNEFDSRLANAFVCMGCAVSTTLYGLKMLGDGRRIIGENSRQSYHLSK